MAEEHRYTHHPLLGTVVEVRVVGDRPVEVDRCVVAEFERLERVFSRFDPDSELERWKRDEVEASVELSTVLAMARDHQIRSRGRFNPLAGVVFRRWEEASLEGTPPSDGELERLAAEIAAPRYDVVDGVAVRRGDCTGLDLHAVAKGWIVDQAARIASDRFRPTSVTVNAGGDLVHRGELPIRIGIEHPLRPYDNEPPIDVIEFADRGLATSGSARRGTRVAGAWRSHVIDPRTGRPVDRQASISVLAASAVEADVAATVLGLDDPAVAVAEASTRGVECLVVDPSGEMLATPGWPSSPGWRGRSGRERFVP